MIFVNELSSDNNEEVAKNAAIKQVIFGRDYFVMVKICIKDYNIFTEDN